MDNMIVAWMLTPIWVVGVCVWWQAWRHPVRRVHRADDASLRSWAEIGRELR